MTNTLQPETPILALSEVAILANNAPEINTGGDINNYDGIN
jgi:hypothetical protein